MSLKIADSLLSLTQFNADLEQLYPTLSSNILMYVEKLLLMDIAQKIIWNTYVKPRNSCVHPYMMNPDECLMNINILMRNTTTFWCSSWRTQQHFDGQNVHPEFQVKVCGAQDTWHNTIGHPTTTIWAQKLYK